MRTLSTQNREVAEGQYTEGKQLRGRTFTLIVREPNHALAADRKKRAR